MGSNFVSKVSNAFSTGGGGVNFELRVQATFVLSLLVEGFCPAMGEQTKRICFQAKRLDYDVDDLVVFTFRNQKEGKLLCQIKHRITATENNSTFQSVISAAWSDFNNHSFDKENDRIALVTAEISNQSQEALRLLHAHAIGSSDEKEFLERVKKPFFSSSKTLDMLNTISGCIAKCNDGEPSEMDLWKFCKAFVLLLFDMDWEESIIYALSTSLIKCNSAKDSQLVWARLIEYAGYCNQRAASIDKKNIDRKILELFNCEGKIPLPLLPVKEIDLFIPTIALIGSWNEDNEFDRRIIEKIGGLDYSTFEAKSRHLLNQMPEYINLSNGIWSVFYKEELLEQCKNGLFDDLITKVIDGAEAVLSQTSNYLKSQDSKYSFRGNEYNHSKELRLNLIKSLCWIKKTLSELPNCNKYKIAAKLSEMVRNILKDADWIKWGSLKECLRYLAELSPECFLDAIERTISNKAAEIQNLFPQNNSLFFSTISYMSELLWALEILAWSPEYLARSICVLGLLESLPYERTAWSNTPINSIVSILIPWYPQTTATIETRHDALLCLKNEKPKIFWEVLKKLLPNQTPSTVSNPEPEYLDVIIPKEINVTALEIRKEYAYLLRLAVDTANKGFHELVDLIRFVEYMEGSTFTDYLSYLEKCIESNDEEKNFVIWFNLKEKVIIAKHNEDMAFDNRLSNIENLIKKSEPKDIRLKYRELYLQGKLMFTSDSFIADWEKLEEEKRVAIKEIFDRFDAKDVEEYGRQVNNMYDVATKLGILLSKNELSIVINENYSGDISKEFTVYCIRSFAYEHGVRSLLETSLIYLDQNFVLDILSSIPFSLDLLEVVNEVLSDDGMYWQKAIMPNRCNTKDSRELKLIMEKLISCKRYVTAVNIVGCSKFESLIDAESIYNLLKLAGTEDSIGNEAINPYAVQQLIGWLQNQKCIDLDLRSEIEFIYLPLFEQFQNVEPHALNTYLSLNPDYFCTMLELMYKKKSGEKNNLQLNKELGTRLLKVLFPFKVIPGTDWNGNFDEMIFTHWIDKVKTWSNENDRYDIAMHTVGTGLSYAPLDTDNLPYHAIMKELNKLDNEELRKGYYLGFINQRGVHFVDPEGKEELKLANDFYNRAKSAESKGFSRYSSLMKKIGDRYKKEANKNMEEMRV